MVRYWSILFAIILNLSLICHGQLIGGTPAQTGNVCGPPTYLCTTTSTSVPTTTIAPLFTSTTPTVTTCAGDCLNTTHHDLTLNGPNVNCITRMTDATVIHNGHSVGNNSVSGSAVESMISKNKTYVAFANDGGSVAVLG